MANYHFINVSILNQALKPLPGRVWKFLLCSIQKILVDSLHTDYVYFLNKIKPCILHWFCNSWFAFYNSCKIDMQIFLKYKINGSMKKTKKHLCLLPGHKLSILKRSLILKMNHFSIFKNMYAISQKPVHLYSEYLCSALGCKARHIVFS